MTRSRTEIQPDKNVLSRGLEREATGVAVSLRARERQVAELVASGHTNRQISQILGISYYTARNVVSSILHKLGVKSRSEIAFHIGLSSSHQETNDSSNE